MDAVAGTISGGEDRMTDKIVIYSGNEVVTYLVSKTVIKGIMMLLDEAIASEAVDWESDVAEREI